MLVHGSHAHALNATNYTSLYKTFPLTYTQVKETILCEKGHNVFFARFNQNKLNSVICHCQHKKIFVQKSDMKDGRRYAFISYLCCSEFYLQFLIQLCPRPRKPSHGTIKLLATDDQHWMKKTIMHCGLHS